MTDASASLSTQITQRSTLSDDRGNSGSTIERVTLADGRTLIVKTVSPESDWIARATGDDGRIETMWRHGIFADMPASVDHTIVDIEGGDGSWSIFMRDVGDMLLQDDVRHGPATTQRILAAAADVHRTFWDLDVPGLCSIEDRYRLLSPATAEREQRFGDADRGGRIKRCWEIFRENTPADVADVIWALAADPTPIANELRTCRQTLIHGDLRIGNAGFDGDRTILLDWGDRTGIAPPAVELAWFIGFDGTRLDMPRDAIIEQFRGLYAEAFDERALELALIGGLVHIAAHIGLGFITAGDDAGREAAKDEAAWWASRVAQALETWSPGA